MYKNLKKEPGGSYYLIHSLTNRNTAALPTDSRQGETTRIVGPPTNRDARLSTTENLLNDTHDLA